MSNGAAAAAPAKRGMRLRARNADKLCAACRRSRRWRGVGAALGADCAGRGIRIGVGALIETNSVKERAR